MLVLALIRPLILTYTLIGFTEESKIQVAAKLVQDVLAYAVDYIATSNSNNNSNNSNNKNNENHEIDSNEKNDHTSFEEALEDALLILQSPLLKVGHKASTFDDEDENIEIDERTDKNKKTTLAIEKAKTKILKKLSLQHLLSHILPTVSSLKHVLEGINSYLQKPLMDYLMQLIKQHKNEVRFRLIQFYFLNPNPNLVNITFFSLSNVISILFNDPMLKADIRQYEKNHNNNSIREFLTVKRY
jgi:hypothetical protein